MDPVAAADADRVPMLVGAFFQRREKALHVGDQDVGGALAGTWTRKPHDGGTALEFETTDDGKTVSGKLVSGGEEVIILSTDKIFQVLLPLGVWVRDHFKGINFSAQDVIDKFGGGPVGLNTIAVSDGVAMGTEGMKASLISREVVADSVELVARGHLFDGLVVLTGCDKTNPGAAMAVARLDIPSVILYNGTIYPGTYKGEAQDIVSVYEAIGAYNAGKLTAEELYATLIHPFEIHNLAAAPAYAPELERLRDRVRGLDVLDDRPVGDYAAFRPHELAAAMYQSAGGGAAVPGGGRERGGAGRGRFAGPHGRAQGRHSTI